MMFLEKSTMYYSNQYNCGVGYTMDHVSTLGGGHQIDQSQISMYKVVTREKWNTQP